MNKWIDIKPSDWFYNAIVDVSNVYLKDNTPLISGMTYGVFNPGSPRLYEEFVALPGQTEFVLSAKVEDTNENPLIVFIDGIRHVYKEIVDENGVSKVVLYGPPRDGAVVAFLSPGVPALDPNGFNRPIGSSGSIYCSVSLPGYIYNPFFETTREYVVVAGRKLRRLNCPDLASLASCMGTKQDVYWIDPATGILYVSTCFNNMSLTVTYGTVAGSKTEIVKPTVANPVYNDRFFPQAKIFRSELYVLINRLRRMFLERFTDVLNVQPGIDQVVTTYQGQKVFKLNGTYPAGVGLLTVKVDGVRKTAGVDYREFDNHTVLFSTPLEKGKVVEFKYMKTTSSRFSDISAGQFYTDHILELEDEQLNDGSYLIPDKTDFPGTFQPEALVFRKELAVAFNRFRKWCLERLR